MRSYKLFSFLLISFFSSFILTACGSKGDLYQIEEVKTDKKSQSDNEKRSSNNVS